MIWLVGAGPMAIDYFKVLSALDDDLVVIGRSQSSADRFKEATGKPVVTGGLDSFLETGPSRPDAVVVSVGVEQLASTTMALIEYGVSRILVEKPGGTSSQEIKAVSALARDRGATVMVAYNRRFYASVRRARELIREEGGVKSFAFEITEWSHVIQNHKKDPRTMHSWFLGNTTHVVDAAFYLGGKPKRIEAFTAGSLEWHPSSSNFAGAGETELGALFSYSGNWEAPGRWSLDVMTQTRRYIFRPFEKLQVQEIGSIAVDEVDVDYRLEEKYKPGLYLQCKDFLQGNYEIMCSIHEQAKMSPIYERMAGY